MATTEVCVECRKRPWTGVDRVCDRCRSWAVDNPLPAGDPPARDGAYRFKGKHWASKDEHWGRA